MLVLWISYLCVEIWAAAKGATGELERVRWQKFSEAKWAARFCEQHPVGAEGGGEEAERWN